MLENQVRKRLDSGSPALSAWMVEPSSIIAEALALENFAAVTVDLQHGGVDADSLVPLFQALAVHDMTPFVRVPWNEPGVIARVLDAGALGIICPMVNNRRDCEQFVSSARYSPLGSRSYGPHRASIAYGPEYAAQANDVVITLAMIETVEAFENLDEILDVPGLDGVFVGPSDLSQSMGLRAAPDWVDGPVLDRIESILARVTARGKIAGISTNSAEYARRMAKSGFAFITVSSDLGFIQHGAREALRVFHS